MERMTPDTIDFNSLSKKQLVELVIAKYNDCFRLEEENKNLKLIQETNEKQIQNDIKERDELREENKKLNIKVASFEGEIKGLNYTIEKLHKEIEEQEAEGGGLFDEIDYRKRECKKLKEKVETLELWLDNKEKLNEEYRKLIQKIDQLEEENENLRKDLFHLTNNYITKCVGCIYNEPKKDGQRKNPTATQGAEGVKGEGREEQGKNARDS